MSRRVSRILCTLALLLTSCAQAEPAAGGKAPDLVSPSGGAAQPAKVSPDASVDQVLDALDARGKGLKGFSAKVSLNEEDDIGLSSTRTGRVWYQQPAGDNARIRVSFDKRENEKQAFEEKIDYVLEGAWLIDRDYQRKKEIKRQVLRPGEKINLLKLGEGPFPLPIGQDKAEVHKLFTVTKEPLDGDKGLADTVHVKLVPKSGTEFAKKFSEIDVWVDPKNQFPKRIDTADAAKARFRTTRLDDVQINPGELGDKDFTLPPVDDKEWERTVEPFSDASSGRE
jgi:outer membrane lipoprotein-sorting protein